MGFYIDSNQKRWDFSFNYGTVLYLKNMIDLDLLEPYRGKPSVIERLSTDYALLLNAMFSVIKYSHKDATDDEIWESLSGDASVVMQEAFYADWSDFSRKTLGRPDVAAAILKMKELIRKGIELGEKEILKIDTNEAVKRMEERIDQQISSMTLTEKYGDSLED